MASAITDKVKERRSRALLGPLPDDFLRINPAGQLQRQQEAADRQAAIALHHQWVSGQNYAMGRLSITVAQAKLAKNYGMTRMDPYARLRVGHCVVETSTDPNGGKNPHWNKAMHCFLTPGINTITLEIFDERSFTVDELIAWAQIPIPQQVLQGETHEDWYPLSGKQGDGVEGMVNLVMSYVSFPAAYQSHHQLVALPKVGSVCLPSTPVKVYMTPQQMAPMPQQQLPVVAPPVLSESELKQIEEMFPNIDKEVIKTVFEANRGNKDGTINSLLQMAE